MKSSNSVRSAAFLRTSLVWVVFLTGFSFAEPEGDGEVKAEDVPEVVLAEDHEQLDLPGIKIRIKEVYVDVDATVCLHGGLLELIACAKDSKEHESIVAVDAKAAHIHAALLLLRAVPGNPAMRKRIEGEDQRWVDLPPSGTGVKVSLVVEDENGEAVERPISDFLMKAEREQFPGEVVEEEAEEEEFPTNTFVFAGSHIFTPEGGKPLYLADADGNVISISTFGDELLCLPGIWGHSNEALMWEVDPTHLPAVGEKVILRLRPQLAGAEEE